MIGENYSDTERRLSLSIDFFFLAKDFSQSERQEGTIGGYVNHMHFLFPLLPKK